MKGKYFNIFVIVSIIMGLCLLAIPIIVVDPYFHYHEPLDFMDYEINNERYQNNGITKNFEYNALITGTSMTENFKTSEFENIFGLKAVKVPYSGGTYGEINKNTVIGLENNKELKIVLRVLDYTGLINDKDLKKHEARESYPHYLTDKNIFNDVKYFWNKEILELSKNMWMNRGKGKITSFDEYANWNDQFVFGKEAVLKTYERGKEQKEQIFTKAVENMVRGNIIQNVVNTADKYPDTIFYIIISPYSICYWDSIKREGKINYVIESERVAIEELLKCENIKLFSYTNNFELTCDLDNYKDQAHYGEWINSQMLQWVHDGKGLLTRDNYEQYLREIKEFYTNYDYEQIYK